VRGYFLLSQQVAKRSMLTVPAGAGKARGGRIVNVASTAGLKGYPYVAAYCAAKHGVVGLTRALALELASKGVTVNAVCPGSGFFPSRMTRGTLATLGAERLAAGAPLGRIGDDSDLKGAALLFASAAGKHITGQILAVDGGVSAVLI